MGHKRTMNVDTEGSLHLSGQVASDAAIDGRVVYVGLANSQLHAIIGDTDAQTATVARQPYRNVIHHRFNTILIM